MLVGILGVAISVFVSIYFLILCTAKKKKITKEHVESVAYTHRNSTVSNHSDVERGNSLPASDAGSSSHHPTATLTNTNHTEEKRPHSQSQVSQGRELPQPPNKEETSASQRNSMDCVSRTSTDVAGDSDPSKHHSPKARRLPAPPPEDALKLSNDESGLNEEPDEDPYASVDDETKTDKKSELIRFKLKTLDINEGSGDSSFYAKVSDCPDEEDTELYAQVDDKRVEEPLNEAATEKIPEDSVPSTSKSVPANPGAYPTPEYASIDKVKKALSVKRKPTTSQASNEPPAPPIPDRNFDADDDANGGAQEQESQEPEPEVEKVPMYDKLCVRESLDHIRKREVVEKERRERYENLPLNGGESSSDLYAQIDENNTEAVYESLSQPGSADGAFQANNVNPDYSTVINPDYSSISELNEPRETSVNLQVRPQRQHHYEMIEHGASTS